jgi:hypothetical protein
MGIVSKTSCALGVGFLLVGAVGSFGADCIGWGRLFGAIFGAGCGI